MTTVADPKSYREVPVDMVLRLIAQARVGIPVECERIWLEQCKRRVEQVNRIRANRWWRKLGLFKAYKPYTLADAEAELRGDFPPYGYDSRRWIMEYKYRPLTKRLITLEGMCSIKLGSDRILLDEGIASVLHSWSDDTTREHEPEPPEPVREP